MAKKMYRYNKGKSSSERTSSSPEFNPDYSYVKKDLRRIASLAGTFFVLMIVLSFIL